MQKRFIIILLIVAFTFLASMYVHAFRDSIVAAWTFEENVDDVSGNGNDGELIGTADWVDGKFGRALNFDGSSVHIEVPFSDSMGVLNQSDFTLAAWFITNVVPKKQVIFQQGDSGGTGRTWLFIHESVGEIRSYLGGNTTASGINTEANIWYHAAVVVTEEGGTDTVQMYIDGVLSGDPFLAGMEDSEGILFIGCHKNVTDLMDGAIDELVLINKALDENEIKKLMEEGVSGVLSIKPGGKLAISWGCIKI